MIVGNPYKIAIQIEQIDVLCSPSGIFNFIINDHLIPGKGITIDLYVVISSLKDSLYNGLKNISHDVGDRPIKEIDFSEGTPDNLIPLDCAELHDYGSLFWLGFSGNEDRLIYTVDFEISYMESRYPKGTIENLINALPQANNLFMKKKDCFITTKI
uniref:Imm42 family immunity protein n=1 Tax=Salmonella enterica TaxID=28901 RepID=UPI003A8C9720